MSDISSKESELRREYKQQSKWTHFDTWLVVRIKELEAKLSEDIECEYCARLTGRTKDE